MDSTAPEFWNRHYETNHKPWDIHGVPPSVHAFIARTAPGSILIPGCGSGYEIEPFHKAGWKVTAIDFAPGAVDSARKNYQHLGVEIHLGDFFAFDFNNAPFDLIYERRFLCALPPHLWEKCSDRVAALLHPEGSWIGTFLYGDKHDGPPFPMNEAQADQILGRNFLCTRTEDVTDFSSFNATDRWQEWRRKK